MAYLDATDWENFREIVDGFGDDVNKDILIWKRYKGVIPLNGSDEDTLQYYPDFQLNCLVQYNVFRTWPITDFTLIGQEDKQSELVYINNSYLQSLSLLDDNGRFAYDPANDRFIHKGVLYYDSGNTPVSATDQNALFSMLVLKRVDVDNLDIPLPG